MGSVIFMALILCLTFPLVATAKDLYVSTTGDDSVTYANNDIDHPWLTFAKAFDSTSIQPGDNIYFRTGTYNLGTESLWNKYTGKDGTAGFPITFSAYENEIVTLTSSASPAIKEERDYQTYQKFVITTPGTFIKLSEDTSVAGPIIQDCTYTMSEGGDNTAFVSVNGASVTGAIVRRNTIVGPCVNGDCTGVHLNTSGIILFRPSDSKILSNAISQFPIGIYFKHANTVESDDGEIAYNYIHHTTRYAAEFNCNHYDIHNNLFGLNNASVQLEESNGGPGGDNNTFNHNTMASGVLAISYGDGYTADGNTITNNIIPALDLNGGTGNSYDYNMYSVGTKLGDNDVENTAPTFVGGESPSNINGFGLVLSTPGYKAGSDVLDIGVDVTMVYGYQPGTGSITRGADGTGSITRGADGTGAIVR